MKRLVVLTRAEAYGGDPERDRADTLFASFDPDCAIWAAEHGLDFINLWRYLGEEEIKADVENAWRLSGALPSLWPALTMDGGSNLVATACHDLVSPLVSSCFAARALNRCLAEVATETVEYHGSDSDVWYVSPSSVSPRAIHRVGRALAGKRPFRFVAEGGPNTSPGLGVPVRQSPWLEPDERIRLVMALSGLNAHEQHFLLARLEREGRRDVFVFHDIDRVLNLPGVSARTLMRLPFALSDVQPWIDERLRDLEAGRFPGDLPDALSSVSSVLGGLLSDFCRRLHHCAATYRAGRFVLDALAPQAVLTGYDVGGNSRSFTAAFLDAGVPAYAVHHAGLATEPADYREFTGARAHFLVWGQYDVRGCRAYRDPGSRIVPVGSMRVDIDAALREHAAGRTSRSRPASHGPLTITLLTARLPEHFAIFARPDRQVDRLREVVSELLSRTDCRILLKPHPRFDYHRVYRALAKEHGERVVFTDRGLRETLADADAVLLVNYCTTAALEAITAGLPVVYHRPDVMSHCHALVEDGGGVVTGSIDALVETVDRIAGDPAYRRELAEQADRFLQRLIAAHGDEAAERTWREIVSVSSVAETPVRAGSRHLLMAMGAVHDAAAFRAAIPRHVQAAVDDPGPQIDRARIANFFLNQIAWREPDRKGHRTLQFIRTCHTIARAWPLGWNDVKTYFPVCIRHDLRRWMGRDRAEARAA